MSLSVLVPLLISLLSLGIAFHAEWRSSRVESKQRVRWRVDAVGSALGVEVRLINEGDTVALFPQIDAARLISAGLRDEFGLTDVQVMPNGGFMSFEAKVGEYRIPDVLEVSWAREAWPRRLVRRKTTVSTRAWSDLVEERLRAFESGSSEVPH